MTTHDLSKFGTEVRRRRESRGLTRPVLTSSIGIGESTLARLEQGRGGQTRLPILGRLAAVLEMSDEDLREVVDDDQLAGRIAAQRDAAGPIPDLTAGGPVFGVPGPSPLQYYREVGTPSPGGWTDYVAMRESDGAVVRFSMRPGPAADEVVNCLRHLDYEVMVRLAPEGG